MLSTKQAFISAYLKGEESHLITSAHLDGMLKASNIQDVLSVIKGTDIGAYLGEVSIEKFDEIDEQLWRYFYECQSKLMWFRFVPDDVRGILRAYMLKYDILNMKSCLWGIQNEGKI